MVNQVIQYVVKRDGMFEQFNEEKIVEAIYKAVQESGEFGYSETKFLAKNVVAIINKRYVDTNPRIEEIQDIVEQVLIKHNHIATAKTYMVYRKQHAVKRAKKYSTINVAETVDEYLDKLDWRVKANANLDYSFGGLLLNLSGKVIAKYWLNSIYPPEIAEAHIDGFMHIHDLDVLGGYCAGWSLRVLIQEGFNGGIGKAEANPPKHLATAFSQMTNFLGSLQNEWAGAQSFSSFDTYMAPFIRMENLSYQTVKQCMQSYIFNMNVPSRWGTQTPFTNVTFDWTCPDDLKNTHPIIAGEEQPFTYGELQKEMNMINRAFIETMCAGDAKGRIFTFPLPTYNITKDFDWDGENVDLLFEMTAKYGAPYFQNFINSDLSPNMIRSMCCRLQLDLRELLKRGNSLFGSAEQTGSVGIVTINCARLGYLHKGNEQGLYKHLNDLMELAKESLEIKREVIKKFLDQGLYPYTKRYLGTYRNHFSTIGINGVHEMILNFTGGKDNITTKTGKAFALKFLDFMRAKLIDFQLQTGHMYNLEATPAEGCMYRFAKEDAKRYSDIIQSGKKGAPYYTNSTQLPVGYTDDLFEALDHQEELQRKYTGGTVVHLYMGERISDAQACKKLVRTVLTKYKIPYITITPTFSICPKHGYLTGEHKYCPKCDIEIQKRKYKSNSL